MIILSLEVHSQTPKCLLLVYFRPASDTDCHSFIVLKSAENFSEQFEVISGNDPSQSLFFLFTNFSFNSFDLILLSAVVRRTLPNQESLFSSDSGKRNQ